MKKLLSILAAVGLTATASTAVVACTSTVKAKDVKIYGDVAAFTKKIKLYKGTILTKNGSDYTTDTAWGTDTIGNEYMVFDKDASSVKDHKDGNHNFFTDEMVKNVTFKIAATELKDSDLETAKGVTTLKADKSVKVTVTMPITPYLKGYAQKVKWTLATVTWNDKGGFTGSKVISEININLPGEAVDAK